MGWLKIKDMKLTDQCAGHEIAGQYMKLQDMNSQDKKYSVNRDYITLQWSVQFFVAAIFLETNTLMHCV